MLKILTIAGGHIGYGHLGRCLPIYDAAKKTGVKVGLFVQNFGKQTLASIDTNIVEINWLDSTCEMLIDTKDLLLIDVLSINNERLNELENLTKSIFVIDDIGNPQYNHCIRVDWSVKSHFLNNNVTNFHITSAEYVPLREKFSHFQTKYIRTRIQKVLITLGGSDVKNMSPHIITFIRQHYPNLKLQVFVGPGFQCTDELIKLIDHNITLLHSPSDEQIVQAMNECDLAIATGGHAMYELAAAGLPTIQVQVVENQKVSKYWADYGFSQFAGWYNSASFWVKLNRSILFYHSPAERDKSAKLGQRLVDGHGAFKLVKKIEMFYVD